MDENWQDIATAPRDGSKVWVRRIYDGRIVKEGWAVWGINSDDAPMRQWADGGLSGIIMPDHAYADTARWLVPDRRYSFPTPTEWLPGKEQSHGQ
ncbi:hypothetical protein J2792_002303 [Novosphingobium capsulatum]|uniref:Uncharacterized protein n=1 Tax=Novosphingobium capsulatum TaxID=13688 RepID=A0ABU1MN39_9SPHN|nr:hypothetical protein [Novosphingobium capsulatum]